MIMNAFITITRPSQRPLLGTDTSYVLSRSGDLVKDISLESISHVLETPSVRRRHYDMDIHTTLMTRQDLVIEILPFTYKTQFGGMF
ncbi:uncharacterized protein PADG_00216 [Paracoccidioides brasiliensis Pb18]|uniref:Uncharacterized protein n=1 Tax=Paracoccidioides brasiliensis (strain Pb18) TaxID=502780 RepID=C1G026_PARBD|nr:uncharacterized protein PADG_00216 [Paracoccidioides brasiliensis Pb18]EEH43927.2 hypothetical protein PADG_00216 [Paracoccidioides brasiliensis Pb18]